MRIYTFIFVFEIAFRIYGSLNWKYFWRKYRNRIDLLIAIISMMDEIPLVKHSRYHICLLVFSVLRSYRISYLFPGVLQLLVKSYIIVLFSKNGGLIFVYIVRCNWRRSGYNQSHIIYLSCSISTCTYLCSIIRW